MLIEYGAPSISTLMQSFIMGIVVKITIIEKITVQIGSAIERLGAT